MKQVRQDRFFTEVFKQESEIQSRTVLSPSAARAFFFFPPSVETQSAEGKSGEGEAASLRITDNGHAEVFWEASELDSHLERLTHTNRL